MDYKVAVCLGAVVVSAIFSSGCNRVDQKKFDALYRSGKAIEVDLENSSAGRVVASEQLLKAFKTEISSLQGRTGNENEAAALKAYSDAADAYRAFLDVRDLDLRGGSRDGRLLLGDAWAAVAAKFNFAVEAAPWTPADKYKWYWVSVGDASEALLSAAKKNLTEASRLVNGQP